MCHQLKAVNCRLFWYKRLWHICRGRPGCKSWSSRTVATTRSTVNWRKFKMRVMRGRTTTTRGNEAQVGGRKPRPWAFAAQSVRAFADLLQWVTVRLEKEGKTSAHSARRARQSHGGRRSRCITSTKIRQSVSMIRAEDAGTLLVKPPINLPVWSRWILEIAPKFSAMGKAPSILTFTIPCTGGIQVSER